MAAAQSQDSELYLQSVSDTKFHLQQLWRYNTHAVEMRIDHLNSMTGAGTEAQTIMVNDIPEINKVSYLMHRIALSSTVQSAAHVEQSTKYKPLLSRSACSNSIDALRDHLYQPSLGASLEQMVTDGDAAAEPGNFCHHYVANGLRSHVTYFKVVLQLSYSEVSRNC